MKRLWTEGALGLDLAGPALDSADPELAQYRSITDLLGFAGRGVIELPASGNLIAGGTPVTAVVVQHAEDGVLDGHEVVFQLDAPKHQYRCFLETLASGAPVVPVASDEMAGCD